MGRFISVDPVIDSRDPQQMHGYAYSNHNPFTFTDPDGRWGLPKFVKKAASTVTDTGKNAANSAARAAKKHAKTLSTVATVLDRAAAAASFVPGAGTLVSAGLSLAAAGTHLAAGEKGKALESTIGAIPGAKAIQLARKAKKLTDPLNKARSSADRTEGLAVSARTRKITAENDLALAQGDLARFHHTLGSKFAADFSYARRRLEDAAASAATSVRRAEQAVETRQSAAAAARNNVSGIAGQYSRTVQRQRAWERASYVAATYTLVGSCSAACASSSASTQRRPSRGTYGGGGGLYAV